MTRMIDCQWFLVRATGTSARIVPSTIEHILMIVTGPGSKWSVLYPFSDSTSLWGGGRMTSSLDMRSHQQHPSLLPVVHTHPHSCPLVPALPGCPTNNIWKVRSILRVVTSHAVPVERHLSPQYCQRCNSTNLQYLVISRTFNAHRAALLYCPNSPIPTPRPNPV